MTFRACVAVGCHGMSLGGSVAALLQRARPGSSHTSLLTITRSPALLLLLPWPRSARIRSHNLKPVHARKTLVAGESILHRQRLQYGQHWRSLSLVCGTGAQDVCAITLFRSRWTFNRSLFVRSSSHGRNISGHIRCSSYSSVWKRSSSTANASVISGDTQTIEELWEEYFADPLQWWDNRIDKKNPRSPDLKHKVTRKALG